MKVILVVVFCILNLTTSAQSKKQVIEFIAQTVQLIRNDKDGNYIGASEEILLDNTFSVDFHLADSIIIINNDAIGNLKIRMNGKSYKDTLGATWLYMTCVDKFKRKVGVRVALPNDAKSSAILYIDKKVETIIYTLEPKREKK